MTLSAALEQELQSNAGLQDLLHWQEGQNSGGREQVGGWVGCSGCIGGRWGTAAERCRAQRPAELAGVPALWWPGADGSMGGRICGLTYGLVGALAHGWVGGRRGLVWAGRVWIGWALHGRVTVWVWVGAVREWVGACMVASGRDKCSGVRGSSEMTCSHLHPQSKHQPAPRPSTEGPRSLQVPAVGPLPQPARDAPEPQACWPFPLSVQTASNATFEGFPPPSASPFEGMPSGLTELPVPPPTAQPLAGAETPTAAAGASSLLAAAPLVPQQGPWQLQGTVPAPHVAQPMAPARLPSLFSPTACEHQVGGRASRAWASIWQPQVRC